MAACDFNAGQRRLTSAADCFDPRNGLSPRCECLGSFCYTSYPVGPASLQKPFRPAAILGTVSKTSGFFHVEEIHPDGCDCGTGRCGFIARHGWRHEQCAGRRARRRSRRGDWRRRWRPHGLRDRRRSGWRRRRRGHLEPSGTHGRHHRRRTGRRRGHGSGQRHGRPQRRPRGRGTRWRRRRGTRRPHLALEFVCRRVSPRLPSSQQASPLGLSPQRD